MKSLMGSGRLEARETNPEQSKAIRDPPPPRVGWAQGGWRPERPILNRTKQLGIDLFEELDGFREAGGQGNQS